MRFYFDSKKALGAVGYVLELNGGRVDYILLIKTLYAADRRALIEYGRTITGDAFYSKPNGPVLDLVEEMTRGDAPKKFQKLWDQHFTQKQKNYQIELLKEPDRGFLSDGELDLIKSFYDEFKLMHHRDLIKH